MAPIRTPCRRQSSVSVRRSSPNSSASQPVRLMISASQVLLLGAQLVHSLHRLSVVGVRLEVLQERRVASIEALGLLLPFRTGLLEERARRFRS